MFFLKKYGNTFGLGNGQFGAPSQKMLLPFSRVSSCRKISDDCMRDCDSGDHVWSLISAIQWTIIRIIYLYTNQKISVFLF